jgi:hypothetical protein
MALTDRNLFTEKPHPSGIGGVQRIYKFTNGWKLSLVNSPIAHCFPFAWEAAVLSPSDGLCYDTPLTNI